MRKEFSTTLALGQLEERSLQFREDVYPYTDYDDIKEQFTFIKESLINQRQQVEDNHTPRAPTLFSPVPSSTPASPRDATQHRVNSS